MKIKKFYNYVTEELTSDLVKHEYSCVENGNLISYTFKYKGYNFIVGFSKYTGDNYLGRLEEQCSIWARNFETKESEFGDLNISNTSALQIYGIINFITKEFIDKYNPDIIQIILHIKNIVQ